MPAAAGSCVPPEPKHWHETCCPPKAQRLTVKNTTRDGAGAVAPAGGLTVTSTKGGENSDMRYSDSSEQAAEFVRLALPFMAQHGIPPSPPHYRVWYDYVSGRNQKLKESVDRALNVHNGISAEFSEELYQRFVEHDDDLTAENLRHEVKTLLADALTKLAESDNQASHYGRVLEDYSKRLSINPGREQLRRALQDLLAETRSMQEANHRLEERLSETNAELERLRKELDDARHAASADALTGIANRKAFDEALASLTQTATDTGHELSLILADVDHFKQFNDQHGHLLGDKVLRFVAHHLQDTVKGTDVVARYGGEEFAVLLPSTPLSGGLTLAERIRTTLQSKRLRRTDTSESVGAVTLSLGVACYRPGEAIQEFLQRADQALYRAKEQGRNCACCER